MVNSVNQNFSNVPYEKLTSEADEKSKLTSVLAALIKNPINKDNWVNLMLASCTIPLFSKSVRRESSVRLTDRLFLALAQNKPEYIEIKTVIDQVKNSVQVHTSKDKKSGFPFKKRERLIEVKDKDAIQEAIELQNKTNEPVMLLSLGNDTDVCGKFNWPGFWGTQEEFITDMMPMNYSALEKRKNPKLKQEFDLKNQAIIDPAKRTDEKKHIPDNGCVLVKNIPVIRQGKNKEFIKVSGTDPVKVPKISVATVAAIDLRKAENRKIYLEDGVFNAKGTELTKNKMRAALRAAAKNQIPHLVLGAMGCGAFKNDPEKIAQYWKEVLEEPEFNNHFERVSFAVLTRRGRDAGNFEVFQKVFETKEEKSS